jgi:hypothetical protein
VSRGRSWAQGGVINMVETWWSLNNGVIWLGLMVLNYHLGCSVVIGQ